jgi:hypothetical protein
LRNTVVTVKKSQAIIDRAWAVRNCRQVGPDRRGAGSTPAWCRTFHTGPVTFGLAFDTADEGADDDIVVTFANIEVDRP